VEAKVAEAKVNLFLTAMDAGNMVKGSHAMLVKVVEKLKTMFISAE
jgi:hypothetical protein